ncbi:YbcC family protein [Methylomonas sp. BW4-1]|uniref:YbcC family protein n=1 Tax=Methylomonas sp. BW4-1 TaxID=3376685 RepID=UPI0040420E4D
MNSAVLSFKTPHAFADAEIASVADGTYSYQTPDILAAVESACTRIAPLWPLQQFVAVNPFLGLRERDFADACEFSTRMGQGEMLMPPSFYAEQYRLGNIQEADISQALQLTGSKLPLKQCLLDLQDLPSQDTALPGNPCYTLAEHLDALRGSQWSLLITDEISKWCAAYFDQGQSAWRMPWRGQPLYAAWRRAAAFDRTPELAGLSSFRQTISALPEQASVALSQILTAMGLPGDRLDDVCHRQLLTIAGWSAWVRYKHWQTSPEQSQDALLQLLAIRLSYDYALLSALASRQEILTWRSHWQDAPQSSSQANLALEVRHVMQWAYELAKQRPLFDKLASGIAATSAGHVDRKNLQAVFCIDVRSEIYRRSLEMQSNTIETLGFAGFFGFPIEYIALGHHHGQPQCPVLLKPAFRIRESVIDADVGELREILEKRWLRKRLNRLWKGFKNSAVSCFSYVEISGLSFAGKLLSDSLGLTRPVVKPGIAGLDKAIVHRIGPVIARQRGRLIAKGPVVETGIALGDRVELARKALMGMSLTDGFARLVLLCGHGSTTVNNPYAAGLDCGACGGHSGEANARVAAAVLNDREVRAGLAAQGLTIPKDTWFVAGLHDTTTDEVRLFDLDQIPHCFSEDLLLLKRWLDQASLLTRQERAPGLGLARHDAATLLKAITQRSRDWSQIRPEWGLAGNTAFIAAPRQRTYHFELNGRVFLHNYDYRQDADKAILSLIMSAPMVVASWINLQYYASTVDNRRFGSGNKALHNVVGTIGILEGNGGDLRSGLPWQSLHDGKTLRHEPVRLTVVIEAPAEMIEHVLANHAEVRQLVDNHWLHLTRIDPLDNRCYRYLKPQHWQAVTDFGKEI